MCKQSEHGSGKHYPLTPINRPEKERARVSSGGEVETVELPNGKHWKQSPSNEYCWSVLRGNGRFSAAVKCVFKIEGRRWIRCRFSETTVLPEE